MLENKLTGRRRYKTLKRRFASDVLILQLEVEGFVTEYSGGQVDGSMQRWWIDAKPEHLTVHGASPNDH